jgi:RNA polymerase sigma-70 factor, ECF subfamily
VVAGPRCHRSLRGRARPWYVATHANGQAANAAYRWDPDKEGYIAEALEVLTLEGTRVKQMTAFMTPEVFPRFGLPVELPPD